MKIVYQIQGCRILARSIIRENETNLWLTSPHSPDGDRTRRRGSLTFASFDEAKAAIIENETNHVELMKQRLSAAEQRLAKVSALTAAQDMTAIGVAWTPDANLSALV